MTTTPPETPDTLAPPDRLATMVDLPADDAGLLDALRRASAEFRGAVRHHVTTETRTLVLDGHGRRYLRIPAVNVTDADVTIGAESVEVNVSPDGVIERADGGRFPRPLGSVMVVYTAGWDPAEVPEDIQAAVLERAAGLVHAGQRGDDVAAMTAGPFSVTYTDTAGTTQRWSDAVIAHQIRRGDRS